MDTQSKDCCAAKTANNHRQNKKGFFAGIFYGLIPHTFCIAFIILSAVGATAGAALVKRLLIIPYFFYTLIIISFVFATISALIYLKWQGLLSWQGIKRKKRYLITLYSTTILVNILFLFVIFPAVVNFNFRQSAQPASALKQYQSLGLSLTLRVDIPCAGHASLIMDELRKIEGVNNIKFRLPNLFDLTYDPIKTSPEAIVSLDIFKTYKASAL